MKNQTAGEFLHSFNSALVFKSYSATEIATSLLAFYLGLDCDARHQRFGAVTSDEAIRQHCKRLNSYNAIVLACAGPDGIIAAIELHPVSCKKSVAAAQSAGLAPSSISTLLVEGDNRPGLGHAIAKAIGDAGINVSFVMAQVVGRRYSALFGSACSL